MYPCRTSTFVQHRQVIQLTIISMMIISSINHSGGILLAVAQQQQQQQPAPSPSPVQDRIGGLFGGAGRAQQVLQCFTGCGQEIVGCGVTCTLGSSQSIAPCFMDCGLSNFVCMNSCFQPSISDVDAFIPGSDTQSTPMG